jgi:hypothetical protein
MSRGTIAPSGGFQVQAHDIGDFRREFRIGRQLERTLPMRLDPIFAPQHADEIMRNPDTLIFSQVPDHLLAGPVRKPRVGVIVAGWYR